MGLIRKDCLWQSESRASRADDGNSHARLGFLQGFSAMERGGEIRAWKLRRGILVAHGAWSLARAPGRGGLGRRGKGLEDLFRATSLSPQACLFT